MGNRVFIAVVVFLWLTTMAWLVFSKVLPPLLVGEPPEFATQTGAEPICWHVHWNERPLGWAASKTVAGIDDVTEIHSRVVLNRLPLDEMTPVWLKSFVNRMGSVDMDARSRLEFDPLDRLSSFRTTIRIGEVSEAIQMNGRVDNSLLQLTVRSGDLEYTVEHNLPASSLLGNDLAPQTYLPNLRLGQTWTMPIYSPFHPPSSPLDILKATVEQEEMLIWHGRPVKTLLVVYRNEGGSGYFKSADHRGKIWVRGDGAVLKQEVKLFDTALSFVRMSDEEAADMAGTTDFWGISAARGHLK